MEVWVDGKLCDLSLNGNNLQDILNDLINNHLGGERTLLEVKVNGKPYEQAAMGLPTNVFRSQIQRLDVETRETTDVAKHFLGNADNYLKAIISSSEIVAELFRVSDERQASEHYLQTLESLQLFMQVLSTTREALSLNFQHELPDGSWPDMHLEKLSSLIQEMLEAQEQQDWILLADLLQYDLGPALRQWQTIIPALSEQVLS